MTLILLLANFFQNEIKLLVCKQFNSLFHFTFYIPQIMGILHLGDYGQITPIKTFDLPLLRKQVPYYVFMHLTYL